METTERLLSSTVRTARGATRTGAQKRRRLDVVLLAVAALLVGGVAMLGAAIGDKERISGLWAGAEVAGDGSARITEVIDYDFGRAHRHGMFRDVPGLGTDARVGVSSATAPDGLLITSYGSGIRARIGDPARTIGGRHRYRLQYSLGDVAPGGRLAWDAVGTEWPVRVGNVRVDVVAPFEFQAARCVQGTAGSQDRCGITQPEPGHLVARIRALRAGHGATLYATSGRRLEVAPGLPVPTSGSPVDPTSGAWRAGLLAVAVALVGAGVTSRLVRRAGRERVLVGGAAEAAWAGSGEGGREVRVDAEKLASLATVEFTPPPELTPAQGGILLAEAVREDHQVAWLIGAAADGYLDIEDHGLSVALLRLPRRDGSATTKMLDRAFGKRQRLPLGAYDPSFAAAWSSLEDEQEEWLRSRWNLWDPAGERRRKLALGWGAVVALCALPVVGLGGALLNWWGWAWAAVLVVGALAAGAGLAAAVRAWELRVRTPAGSGLWLRIESFRRFLAASEAHHADEAAKRGVLREYTAWAVALGELDRWSEAVAASTVAADGASYAASVPRLTSAAFESTLEPPPPPSASDGGWSSGSSGSSGGGGGGVGGGSGGGGGGSW
jgi:uncharacterized membrane protein YgcG